MCARPSKLIAMKKLLPGKVLLPRAAIARRVAGLGRQIADAYAGHELVIVPLLTGGLIFTADLIRRLPIKMRLDVAAVSSYPGKAIRSRGATIVLPPQLNIRRRHVLIVDDILDSGRTLTAMQNMLRRRQAASVKTCVLLRKEQARRAGLLADFIGFDIPDAFVVGYGMDFNHLYRNLPDVVQLKTPL